jgi:hypothetical protein
MIRTSQCWTEAERIGRVFHKQSLLNDKVEGSPGCFAKLQEFARNFFKQMR